jgi:hypothetical protein
MERYKRFEALRLTDITTDSSGGVDRYSLLADIEVLTRGASLLRQRLDSVTVPEWDVLLTVAAMVDPDLADAHTGFDPHSDEFSQELREQVLASLMRASATCPALVPSMEDVADALDAMASCRRDRLPDPEAGRQASLYGLRRGHNNKFIHQTANTNQRLSSNLTYAIRAYERTDAMLRANHPADPVEDVSRNEPKVDL